MKITNRRFGTLSTGEAVTLWRMESEGGLVAEVLDYGVTIRSLQVPDKNGRLTDVVLGYDSLTAYETHNAFFGATVGRFANRIKDARFELNGKTYRLAANNGANHIHGGPTGFHRRIFQAESQKDGVLFSYLSKDGEEGYPGNLLVTVKVSWQGNRLTLHYTARCDMDTVLNMTNHSYFNLDGQGDVGKQILMIASDGYTPTDENLIPTGEIQSVEGTAVDFRQPKPIGRDLEKKEACTLMGKCYDTNLVLNGENPAAVAVSARSGIVMTMDTTEPGVQLYTPGPMDAMPTKNGTVYGERPAFCLETQHFPDSMHHPQWPTCVLQSGKLFESETGYTFTISN